MVVHSVVQWSCCPTAKPSPPTQLCCWPTNGTPLATWLRRTRAPGRRRTWYLPDATRRLWVRSTHNSKWKPLKCATRVMALGTHRYNMSGLLNQVWNTLVSSVYIQVYICIHGRQVLIKKCSCTKIYQIKVTNKIELKKISYCHFENHNLSQAYTNVKTQL